jgi:hypothetical protein
MREGEGDEVVVEPNMRDCSMDGYQLSIVILFTEWMIRTGRGGFEGEWRKSRGLKELAGLRRLGETVEMCGKVLNPIRDQGPPAISQTTDFPI